MSDQNLHPLAGAFERVERAAEHLIDLRPRIDAMRHQHRQVFLAQFDADPLHQGQIPGSAQASMRIPYLGRGNLLQPSKRPRLPRV